LPDPPAIPTKEGGAELDVSGVWTFTPMSPEIGINETGTSGTKLLQTPTAGRVSVLIKLFFFVADKEAE